MIPAGTYTILIHSVANGQLDATVIDTGDRIRIKLWPNQAQRLKIACTHQRHGHQLEGGQVRIDVKMHPRYGNSVAAIFAVKQRDDLVSDVDVITAKPYEFF